MNIRKLCNNYDIIVIDNKDYNKLIEFLNKENIEFRNYKDPEALAIDAETASIGSLYKDKDIEILEEVSESVWDEIPTLMAPFISNLISNRIENYECWRNKNNE